VQQRDHRTLGFMHDLVDQSERVHRARAEPDKRDIGPLASGRGADVLDVDLAGDDVVTERDHRRRDKREAVWRSLAINTRRC
jgi:hypothetical protein